MGMSTGQREQLLEAESQREGFAVGNWVVEDMAGERQAA